MLVTAKVKQDVDITVTITMLESSWLLWLQEQDERKVGEIGSEVFFVVNEAVQELSNTLSKSTSAPKEKKSVE